MERDESPAFLWNPAGVNVAAALAPAVLDAVRKGLANAAEGSAEEFGGILLGSYTADDAEGYLVSVDGFEPLTIEHRYGTSYSLSLRDERRLRQRIERLEHGRSGTRAVGFFRAHLRRGLYLDQRDFEVFQSEFRHPAAIFMLARPEEEGGATGAIFVWEGDDIRRHASYLEFPVGPAVAAPVTVAARQPAARPKAAVYAPAADELPRPVVNELPGVNWRLPHVSLPLPKVSLPKFRLRLALHAPAPQLARLRPAVVLFAALGLPLAAFYLGRDVGLHEHQDGKTARNAAALNVKRRLAVRPRIAPVETAEALPAAVPRPLPPTVATSEASVPTAVPDEGGNDVEPPPVKREPVAKPAARPPHNYRERSADSARVKAATRRVWRDPGPRVAEPRLPDPPELALAAPAPHVTTLPAILFRPRPSGPKVVAFVKPARSGFRRMLRAIAGKQDTFVPANPLEHPMPASAGVPPVQGDATVELAAKIDRSGKVVTVKVVDGNEKFATLSADALQRWKFEPARQNGAPVESEMLVRFEFSNTNR